MAHRRESGPLLRIAKTLTADMIADVSQLKVAVVVRMREAVAEKLDGERWMFEAQNPATSLR